MDKRVVGKKPCRRVSLQELEPIRRLCKVTKHAPSQVKVVDLDCRHFILFGKARRRKEQQSNNCWGETENGILLRQERKLKIRLFKVLPSSLLAPQLAASSYPVSLLLPLGTLKRLSTGLHCAHSCCVFIRKRNKRQALEFRDELSLSVFSFPMDLLRLSPCSDLGPEVSKSARLNRQIKDLGRV
jgi:hypothetical protein